ncbi:uncharacterized protein A4U43_C06F15050 [Asparagus officinalis]|uniref:Glabrous enhancer-binding protein-like DBD domain-containing protein n=1 Tax=Asparagus officinalis TaxID=4686 RepID=A0A5P1EM14_ASPOF|nr:uncharacterized protein LOC109844989 [Asparagus officinalis]ONK67042.1 uncharacterized protein A4U43_C06F15050 [Asparagus officinalis]
MSPEPPASAQAQAAGAAGAKAKSDENAQEDAIKILKAVIEFRAKNGGSIPTPTTMDPVFRSLKGSLHEELRSVDHLYSRFRSLKEKYRRACKDGVGPTDFDRAFFDLSARAWDKEEAGTKKKKKTTETKKAVTDVVTNAADAGDDADDVHDGDEEEDENEEEVEEDDEEENEDVADGYFMYLSGQARKYWEQLGLPIATLEVGLKFLDRSKAAALEKKWMAHFEEGLKIEAQSHELYLEICSTLLGGLKRKRVDDD